MKYIPLIARYLLGALFVVFSLNYWFKFIPMEGPAEGSLAAGFIGALYASGFLQVVKILELLSALLLLSGRFVNLALAVLGPMIVVIALYHIYIVKDGYAMAGLIGILALATLSGQRNFIQALLASK